MSTTAHIHTRTARPAWRRGAFAVLAGLLLAAAIAAAVVLGTGWWQLARVRVRPGPRPARRHRARVSRRASCTRAPSRSTTRCTATGARQCSALAAVVLPAGYLVGALAWAFHISLDRAVGYGMRTRDGFQRS